MRNIFDKNIFIVGIIATILLVSVFSPVGQHVMAEENGANVYTDKEIYSIGENVTCGIENTLNKTIYSPHLTIQRFVNEKWINIFGTPYNWTYFPLHLGEKWDYLWNQKNRSGKQVEPGYYRAAISYDNRTGYADFSVNHPPVADFSPPSPYTLPPTVNETVQFTDNSTDPDGYITSWSWHFGDGNTSNEQNPKHTYTNPGNYTVPLTVTDNDGATDTASKVLKVIDVPLINVTPYADVYVDDNADPDWYDATHVRTIQEGVNNASWRDTVFVYNGTYFENVIVNKTINLTGEDRDTTVIDGGGREDVVRLSADDVNITGFTIQNSGHDSSNSGVKIISNSNKITQNTITDNSRGIMVNNSISNNIITHNNIKSNSHDGIFLSSWSHSTIISDNTIKSNARNAISVWYSDNNFIAKNIISKTGENGILLFRSHGNDLQNNSMFNCGVEIRGDTLLEWQHNIDTSNNVNDKPIYYYRNEDSLNIPSNAGQVILVNCTYCTGNDLFLMDGSVGLELAFSNLNTFKYNTISNQSSEGIVLYSSDGNHIGWNNIRNINGYGLDMDYSRNNQIYHNSIKFNHFGISLEYESNENTITSNDISYNQQTDKERYGIFIHHNSNKNLIANNLINNHKYGINQQSGSNNTFRGNIIENNTVDGIALFSGSDNLIYHNNFKNNTRWNADGYHGNNMWYNITLQEGNYWDDYTGTDTDGDGIGDTPYDIPRSESKDRYPLMEPYSSRKNQPPIPSFTYSPESPVVGERIAFTDTSTDADGYITSWSWDFGDETTSNKQNPTHVYTQSGNYTVALTVTDNTRETMGIATVIEVIASTCKATIYTDEECHLPGETVTYGIANNINSAKPISIGCLTIQHSSNGEWENVSGTICTIGLLHGGEKWELTWNITKEMESGSYRVVGEYGIGDADCTGYAYFSVTTCDELVYTDKEEYVIGETVTYGIENTLSCNRTISIGSLTIQHSVDGEWENVSGPIYTIGLLGPGEKWENTWNITNEIKPGQYRVKGGYGIGDVDCTGYAYFNITEEELPELYMEAPTKVTTGKTFTVTIYSDSGTVNGATVTFDGQSKTTIDGQVNFTAPEETGNFTVTATKTGYQKATATVGITKQSGLPELVITLGVSSIAPMEEETEKTIPVTVYCYNQSVSDIHLVVLESDNLTISLISPNISLSPGEKQDLLIEITTPQLEENVTAVSKTIKVQAVGSSNFAVSSNVEQLNIEILKKSGVTPGFELVFALLAIVIVSMVLLRKKKKKNS